MIVPGSIRVVDSHTEGEPTRVIVDGWPALAASTMSGRRDELRERWDHLRRAVVCEPRGHAAIVGALLTAPEHPGSTAGIVFFNNETYLGMCGHGLIGVVRTLADLGRLEPGTATFDTPAGTVRATLADDGAVTIANVPAICHALDVAVDVPGVGHVTGDVAYGGNWFFLAEEHDVPLTLSNADALTERTRTILAAIGAQGITGAGGAAIDHVELSGPPLRADADARNFVLCSGGEYDRSPCGTGTSAAMIVRHARGGLAPGVVWRQESITGSRFEGWLEPSADGTLVPHIRGRAWVTAESVLRFAADDPFRTGIAAA